MLSDGVVAASYAFGGQDDLPELGLAGPEVGRRSHQPEMPHPAEALAVAGRDFRPVPLEVSRPGHERTVVVHTERVDVLDDPQSLGGSRDLRARGNLAARED